jgi:peptidoglycan/xylan/chitin deacetylase (PgdA/CDA1 family)
MRSGLSLLIALAFTAVSFAAPVTQAPASGSLPEYKNCNRPGVFALTYDDGPNQYSYELAKSLRQQGIKATFFTNGHNAV